MYIERGLRDYIEHPDYTDVHNHLKYKNKYINRFVGDIQIEKGVQYRINVPGGYDLLTDICFEYCRSDIPQFDRFEQLPPELSEIIKSYALTPCSTVNIYLCASGIVLSRATTCIMPRTIKKEFDFNMVYTDNFGLLHHIDKHLVTCACSKNSELYFLIDATDDCTLHIEYTATILCEKLRTMIIDGIYIYDVDTNIQIQTGIVGTRFSDYVLQCHDKIERIRMFDEIRGEIQKNNEIDIENEQRSAFGTFQNGL